MQLAFTSAWRRLALPDGERRRAIDPLSVPLYAMLAGAALLIASAIAATDFRYDGASVTPPLLAIAIFAGCAIGLRRCGFGALAGAMEVTAILAAVSAAGAFASLIAAATARPYADEWLMAADAALFYGFDWRAAIASIAGREQLLIAASHVYASLHWQPIVLTLALFALGKGSRCWVFATAWAITLAATIAIFPFLPALGGYLHFGIPQSDMPGVLVRAAWLHAAILEPVRDGSLRVLEAGVLEGVVTFPSFHAAAAVLLAWGFWGLRWLRWPGVALNAAMIAASVVIGGHYLVDVVAGCTIAGGAIWCASALLRMAASGRGPTVS